MGTAYGLNRFNGLQFKSILVDQVSSNSLINNNIKQLLSHPNGEIWVGTEGGLNVLNPRNLRFKYIEFPFSKTKNEGIEIRDLALDEEQQVWALSNKGLFKINPKTLKIYWIWAPQPDFIKQPFFQIHLGKNEILLAGRGLYSIDYEGKNPKKYLSGIQIFDIKPKESETYYLACDSGLVAWNKNTNQLHFEISGIEVRQMLGKGKKLKCLATAGGGAYFWNEKIQNWTISGPRPGQSQSLKSHWLDCIFEDKYGILWFGSGDQGVFKLDPNVQFFHFIQITDPKGKVISEPSVKSIIEKEEGEFWVATETGLFSIREENLTCQKFDFQPIVQSFLLWDNQIYLGTKAGLYHWKGQRFQKTSPVPQVSILGMVRAHNKIWMTTPEGLLLFEPGKNLISKLLSGKNLNAIFVNKESKVWISGNQELWQFTADGQQIRHYTHDPENNFSLPSHELRPQFEDKNGHLWLTSQGAGLVRLDPENQEFFSLGEANGLDSNFISSMVVDEEERIWLSSQKGILEFLPNSSTFLSFGYSEGLGTEDFSPNAVCLTKSEKLAFGSKDGLVFFDPKILNHTHFRPKVEISGIKILGKKVDFKVPISKLKELALNHKQNLFSIQFQSISYTFPKKTKIFFRLLGLEKDWTEANGRDEISYSNLELKDYVFEIKAQNYDGVESQIVRLPIVVVPPFWKTLEFKILSLFSLVLIIWLIYQSRINAEKRRNLRLENLVRNRTQELEEKNGRILQQSQLLNEEKLKLEESQRLIYNNIEYGSRIQQATMPSLADIQHFLPDSFIFFKPKDVVSGDFYWFMERRDRIFIAAVDCTGHGIPGAFLSMIGYEKLSKALSEEGLENPALILDSLENSLQDLFRTENLEAGSSDGMELSLVAIDKSFNTMKFAGAHRPIFVVRDGELTEHKGDAFGVGGFYQNKKMEKFSALDVPIREGDMVYLFSDGFVDQFDPTSGKKYLTKNFMELLRKLAPLPASKQKMALEAEFHQFAKGSPQIDDVLVLGFRIPSQGPRSVF